MTAKSLHRVEAGQGQTYTLNIKNQNSMMQTFCLFQKMPHILGAGINVIPLAWMVGAVAGGSPTQPTPGGFTWTIDYSAYTGYLQNMGDAANPRRFSTAKQETVLLEEANLLEATYQGSFPAGVPNFTGSPTQGPGGEIVIKSDGSIPSNQQQQAQRKELNLGIGMNQKPAIAVQLLANETYQFTPKPTYYLLSGTFIEGQVIDVSITSPPYQVQFEGTTTMDLVYTPKNLFEPA